MDIQTRNLFNIIFQEAHVVDFDFSQWDRRLRLVVVAGLFGDNFEGRGPLHNVDFIRVKEFSWHATHLDVVLDSPDDYCQWVIMDFHVGKQSQFYRIRLSSSDPTSSSPTPMMQVTCSDVQISELDAGVVDRVNPEWNRPGCPLARPGFEELLRILKRR